MNEITVTTFVQVPRSKAWEYWTSPTHIIHWNFASADWHCPTATNQLELGGEFHYIMSAKDGSFSFDFWGTYTKIETEKSIEILLGDGRKMTVQFEETTDGTIITEIFEPEKINSLELQKAGWQAIVDNFKKYISTN